MKIMYEAQRQQNMALLEQKTPGSHVWTALAIFRIDPKTLRRDGPVHMDRENLATIELGCFICEQPYDDATAARPCPGEASP